MWTQKAFYWTSLQTVYCMKNLNLTALNEMQIEIVFFFFVDIDKDEIQNKKALSAIQESLIGFTGNLENKTFLHEGALIELDPEKYRPICRVYFFLLNDLLIVGKVKNENKYVQINR